MSNAYLWPNDQSRMVDDLLSTQSIQVGEWQSMDVSSSPLHWTHEILDAEVRLHVPSTTTRLGILTGADFPWAEDHFQERVAGKPLNPGFEYKRWPWHVGQTDLHKPDGQFSHTYMERYWPKWAGDDDEAAQLKQKFGEEPVTGVRYEYGDLADVVALLQKSPMSRQAYLPVWFPEDTGVVHGERVPCSLGYHFLIRDGYLTCRYYLRSCDILRHFRNDLYLTGRLVQWVAEQLPGIVPGTLTTYISSLHAFVGDVARIRRDML